MRLRTGSFHTLCIPGHVYHDRVCRIVYYRQGARDYLVNILESTNQLGFLFVSNINLKPFKLKAIPRET